MKCVNHPEIDATGTCVKCGKSLCIDCVRWLHGKTYCHPCAYNIPTQKAGAASTPTSSEARRIDVSQDKASKLLEASKILFYLALIIGVIIPSFIVIVLAHMGAWPDIPTKILGALLYTGGALLISAAFCRIVVVINRRDIERITTVPTMPSEDTIKPNSRLGKLTDQPTTLGTKMAPAVPSEYVLTQNGGLNSTKCVSHPEIDATGICTKCGKSLCCHCIEQLNKKTYCQICAKELLLSHKAVIPLILAKKLGRTDFYDATSHYQYLKYFNDLAMLFLGLGLCLTFLLPMCLFIPLVVTPEGQETLNNMVKTGLTLDTIGIVLLFVSMYLNLSVIIGTRKAILLGIVLVIFGIVYLVKF